jgi:hypothetical protein
MNYVLSYKVSICPIDQDIDLPAYVLPKQYVIDVSIQHSSSVDFTEGITLGRTSPPEATIRLKKSTQLAASLRNYQWRLAHVSVYYTVNNLDYYPAFCGIVTGRTEEMNAVSFRCQGYLTLLEYYKNNTPLWKSKPAATYIPDSAYTSVTVETLTYWQNLVREQDPTTSFGMDVGVINTIFWIIGGRPYKYKPYYKYIGEVPRFYFDCDHAPIYPQFTWLNQENIADDFASLASAAGGQITQTTDGVVRFINPHSFAPSPKNITITDSKFASLSIEEESAVTFNKVVMTFSPRYLGANQVVLDDPIGKYLPYGEEFRHEIEFPQPVDRLTNNTYFGSGVSFGASGGYFGIDQYINSKDFVTAVDFTGETALVDLKIPRLNNIFYPRYRFTWNTITNQGTWSVQNDRRKTPGQYMELLVTPSKAQVGNVNRPLYLAKITLYGIPVLAGEPQTLKRDIDLDFTGLVDAGIVPSGLREVQVKENAYVQSKDHAVRLIDVIKYLHKRPRPAINITDLVYDSRIQLGDVITLNSQFYSISGLYKVTSLNIKNTGALMDLTLVDVSDIKTRNQFFIVGSGYANNDVRYLSW